MTFDRKVVFGAIAPAPALPVIAKHPELIQWVIALGILAMAWLLHRQIKAHDENNKRHWETTQENQKSIHKALTEIAVTKALCDERHRGAGK